ncbi:MT-A70 family methyltransferase [Bradyrhizobium paxllaeri]|uniref:MT-A70 family methyltransferase n=1 Tax=Bradyrhizobium paxllaeri TaxID=190148 RepID=UPI001FE26FEA|nr:MT-A70 family methyltransferase [Bradyrhizobium paxllaeri]
MLAEVERGTGPGRGKKVSGLSTSFRAFLKKIGLQKDTALEAQRIGTLPDPELIKAFERARADDRLLYFTDLIRVARPWWKKESRTQREQALGAKIMALPEQKFGVILEDFEWDFETFSRITGMDRHASNHYPTAAEAHTPEEIVERTKERASVAADDSALFMWVPNPFLSTGIKVLELRGYRYVTNWAWTKDGLGTGYWNRETHELLLLGIKGNLPCPAMGEQWPSSKHGERREHSQKPDWQYELIEAYFPTLPKIELNARSGRAGWVSWGNEAPEAA